MDGFGSRLRAFRQMRGWSQEYVGLELGVSKATVSKWETGRAQPSLEHLAAIRSMYEVDGGTLDYLIAGVALTGGPSDALPKTSAEVQPAFAKTLTAVPSLDADEQALLLRFRKLRQSQRQGLLQLLQEL